MRAKISIIVLLTSIAIVTPVVTDTSVTYSKLQMKQFKDGAGTILDIQIANVFSQVTVEFESMICYNSPAIDSLVERELCLDLSPTKCGVKCKNGTAYAMDDAVSFVTLFIIRASVTCDVDGNTRLQCTHDNTEANKMLFTCPREMARHLMVKSPFAIKSVTAASPSYPRSWVDQGWVQHTNAILKSVASISLANSGSYFELSGPNTFPILLANLPKPPSSPPCHQNVFMAGAEVPTRDGGRLLALSTTQHYDKRHEQLISSSLAWLARASSAPDSSALVDVSPNSVASASDRSKRVYVWRVPDVDQKHGSAAVADVATELGKRLREGRGVLIFFGSKTRWEAVEQFLTEHGMYYLEEPVSDEDREITLSNRVATRLPKVYKNLRMILTDMANNELYWDRNPSWISDKAVLTRNCRDDYLLQNNQTQFQEMLAHALCNNRDIVTFMPCTFQPACTDNTCGGIVVSGRPCTNKIQHFDFINQLLNFLTDRPACLSQFDTAGVHPGPVHNLVKRIGSYRIRLGKSANQRPLSWEPHLVESELAYGRGNSRELLSTGLYLPALTRARVRVVSAQPANGGIELTVGYNLDVLATKGWYGERSCLARPWLDMSQVYSKQAFNDNREAELFSPFGGLIHVVHQMPSEVIDYDGAEFHIELEFHRVVQAPYVDSKLASTSPRHLTEAASSEDSPAPWGEFRSGFAIVGAPRSGFERVDSNTLLAMRFIERTARLSIMIGGPTFGHWRLQMQQRIHSDVDLQCYNVKCRGYSGNPLYVYVDYPSDRHNTDRPYESLLDGAALIADKVPNSRDVFYHELGHNFSPMSLMFGTENREVAADFLLVLLRQFLHGLDLTNSPFLFNRYYDYRVPVGDASLCQIAASYDWSRIPTSGMLVDLFPALIITNYFGLNVLAEVQRQYLWHYAKGPIEAAHRARVASAVFSNTTGYNLQPIFAFFNYPIDPTLSTGNAGIDQLLSQESRLPAFFPGSSWVAGCLPDRLRDIEQRFGGHLVRVAVLGGAAAAAADADLFDRPYFTQDSPHQFLRERLVNA